MKRIVAIDIGAYLTKVTIAEPKGKILDLVAFKYFFTPYQKEDELDEEAFFAELFSLLPQDKLKTARLAIGLASSTTNFSLFHVPPMSHSDLQRGIISEAKRTIRPAPADNDILRYVIIKNSKSDDSRQNSVLAASGLQSEIDRHFKLFQSQGLSPSFIGSAASSLMVYPLGYYRQLPENWCFIDIGYTNTTIVIFSGSVPALVRTILFAGRDFVRAISTEKKISNEKAQEMLLKQALSKCGQVLNMLLLENKY